MTPDQSKYMRFDLASPLTLGKKTHTWYIRAKSDGAILGKISWFSRWRQYCFFPMPGAVFSRGCLNDIETFIVEQMAARKK